MIEALVGFKQLTRDELEAHYLAGRCCKERVVHALVSKANIDLSFQMATAIDLLSVDTEASTNRQLTGDRYTPVASCCSDGIQLIAKARTVRAIEAIGWWCWRRNNSGPCW